MEADFSIHFGRLSFWPLNFWPFKFLAGSLSSFILFRRAAYPYFG
jgi:hypothetical protein